MSEVIQRNPQEAYEEARAAGLVCFLPNDNELYIDIDVPDGDINGTVLFTLANNGLLYEEAVYTESKSGNVHVYLRINKPLPVTARIAIQVALGSDPVKEALSLVRCLLGNGEAAIALFETPSEAVKLLGKWGKPIPVPTPAADAQPVSQPKSQWAGPKARGKRAAANAREAEQNAAEVPPFSDDDVPF